MKMAALAMRGGFIYFRLVVCKAPAGRGMKKGLPK